MKRYLSGIHEKFGHLATWLPDDKLRLGDVGILEKGRFFRKTTLKALRIPFKRRLGNVGGDWDHSSGSDVSVDFGGKAESGAEGGPGGRALVNLGSSGAFLFQALGCRSQTIEDMGRAGDEILLAFRAGDYEKNWVVIDRLVTARSATVVISDSATACVEFAGKAPITSVPALADASLGIKVEKWEGEVTRFVTATDLSPMFGASRLRAALFGQPRVDPLRADEAIVDAEPKKAGTLAAVTIEEQIGTL